MKILFAPDSFKGSLSALESCDILEKVTQRIFPGARTVSVPVADGGEGTVDALLRAMGARRIQTPVTGPLFEPETAEWGLLPDGKTAIMEMAQASGLPYVPAECRDPRQTTSLGTGEMMAAALKMGVRNILIGIGGSATNDGGMGMLAALGARFTDKDGQDVRPVGGQMKQVEHVDLTALMPQLKQAQITVICDVTNPLLGENGATFVYGPQKGASPQIREELEAGMAHYAAIVSNAAEREIAHFPGAGAAGGLGAALGGVLGAKLKSGIDAVLDAVDFDQKLEGVSLAITGEGRIDGQSVQFGKVPAGVARRCAAKGIPTAVIVGGIGDGAEGLFDLCESTIQTTVNGPMSLEQAMRDAPALYEAAAERLLRAIRIGMNMAIKG
ncbi:MAG: glycerate kinase [Clostridia bacterium]|nr:glycerate kinase [Clostridia bacterium]